MKITILITALICVAAFGKAFAQRQPYDSESRGKVVNERTGNPADGATIRFVPSEEILFADEAGRFVVERDFDSICISGVGLQPLGISREEFLKMKGVIAVPSAAVDLEAVTVTSAPGEVFKSISKLDIALKPIASSQDLLPLVPGLFIGQHAGGGKAEQIFLRGFDLDHGTDINISVDGMPVNMVSHAHGQGYADLHFLIPELIEKVQFQKGPYFPEKGDFTTAGFVAFNTLSVLDSNMVKIEAGQFNTYRGVGMFNLLPEKKFAKRQSAFVAAEGMSSDGYFDNPQNFSRVNLFGKYNAQLNERNNLVFSASYFTSKWNASGQIPERAFRDGLISFFGAIDPNEGGKTGRKNMNVQLNSDLGNGGYLKNQIYLTGYDFELYSNFTFFSVDSINGDQIRQKEKRLQLGYNGSYNKAGFLFNKKITTEIGVNLRFDGTKDSELSRTKDRVTVTDAIMRGDIDQLNTAAYVKESVQLSRKVNIITGLRFDNFNFRYMDALAGNKVSRAERAIVSPKFNIYYQASNKTQFYLSAGKGFHSNDTRVSVLRSGRNILPSVYGSDLGLIWKPFRNLLINPALWYLRLDQEFVYVGDEGIVEPSGRSRRFGADLSVRFQPVRWLFLDFDGNYSHGRAIDEAKGQDLLPLAPRLTSTGGIIYQSRKGLQAGIHYRYMGDRPANEDNSVVAKGYFVTDLVVNFRRPGYEAGFSIINLFDVRWKETQFDTESRLKDEPFPVSEIHFTPGAPFFFKAGFTYFFKY